jgi:hypothetical protein
MAPMPPQTQLLQYQIGLIPLGPLEIIQPPRIDQGPLKIPLLLIILTQEQQALAQLLIHCVLLVLALEVELEGLDGFVLELQAHEVVELGELVHGDALPVFAVLGALVAF